MGLFEDITFGILPGRFNNSKPKASAPMPVTKQVGLTERPEFKQAADVFSPTQTQEDIQRSPLISELTRMQDVARRKAAGAVQRGFQRSGFGRSTFAPQAAAQAGAQAQVPFLSRS
jgi:hypothetical protein